MPPVLVFPFSNRPLFPGVYQPCEVTNEQLYANDPDFFVGHLGPRLKYSACEWPDGATLSDAFSLTTQAGATANLLSPRTGPASTRGTISWRVTPNSVSPFRIA